MSVSIRYWTMCCVCLVKTQIIQPASVGQFDDAHLTDNHEVAGSTPTG